MPETHNYTILFGLICVPLYVKIIIIIIIIIIIKIIITTMKKKDKYYVTFIMSKM